MMTAAGNIAVLSFKELRKVRIYAESSSLIVHNNNQPLIKSNRQIQARESLALRGTTNNNNNLYLITS